MDTSESDCENKSMPFEKKFPVSGVVIKGIYPSFVYNITSKSGCAICQKKIYFSVVTIFMVKKNAAGHISEAFTVQKLTIKEAGQFSRCNLR